MEVAHTAIIKLFAHFSGDGGGDKLAGLGLLVEALRFVSLTMRATVAWVRSRVEPSAPYVTETKREPKALKLPTFLREYDKLAPQCAAEGVDHTRYLLRLAEEKPYLKFWA